MLLVRLTWENASVLTVSNLTVGRGYRDLFTDVSFSVGAGERIAILGPNGSGESTLMECIADRLTPRSGSVTRNPPALAVGYLHQSHDVADIAATVAELVQSEMALEEQLADVWRLHQTTRGGARLHRRAAPVDHDAGSQWCPTSAHWIRARRSGLKLTSRTRSPIDMATSYPNLHFDRPDSGSYSAAAQR